MTYPPMSDLHVEVVLRPDVATRQLARAADLLRAASAGELDFGAAQRWLIAFEEFAGQRGES